MTTLPAGRFVLFAWNGHTVKLGHYQGRPVVEMDGEAEAYLDVPTHRFFQRNPGLYEECIKRAALAAVGHA